MLSSKNAKLTTLRASVSEKLVELLGNPEEGENDIIQDLTEYIVVLMCNGKTRNQAKTQLEPFLGEANSALLASWLWDNLSENDLNPIQNAASDVENANGDGEAAGMKQASKIDINSPNDGKQLSEGIKCEDDEDVSSESLEEGEIPRTHEPIKESELSEMGHDKSLKCISSRLGTFRGEFSAGATGNIKHKNVYSRSLQFRKSDANVAGRRLFSRAAADAMLYQHAYRNDRLMRKSGTVWDRLGKRIEDGGIWENANINVVEQIKTEAFKCDGEGIERNWLMHSLHGRMLGNFDIKAEESDGNKRRFSDVNSHQSGVSDSMDDEFVFNKKVRRSFCHEDNDVQSENCVSSGAGTPRSQKICNASGPDACTSSQLKKMPEGRLIGEILESPETVVSYSTAVTEEPACKSDSNATVNLRPVQYQLMDMKLRLQQLETDIFRLKSEQEEKKVQYPFKSGPMNHLEMVESRTVVVTNVHIAATKETLRSYFDECGIVDEVIKLTESMGDKQKVSAYVTFASKHSADKALALSGTVFLGRIIWVRMAGRLPLQSMCPAGTDRIRRPEQKFWRSSPAAHIYNASSSSSSEAAKYKPLPTA